MKKYMILFASLFYLVFIGGISSSAATDPVYSDGYFYYHLRSGYVSICGYFGEEETVTIPSSIVTLPVSCIESGSFDDCESVESIILPDTIMELQKNALSGAPNLTSVTNASGTANEDALNGDEVIEKPAAQTEETTSANDTTTATTKEESSGEAGEKEYEESDDSSKSNQETEKNKKEIERLSEGQTVEKEEMTTATTEESLSSFPEATTEETFAATESAIEEEDSAEDDDPFASAANRTVRKNRILRILFLFAIGSFAILFVAWKIVNRDTK